MISWKNYGRNLSFPPEIGLKVAVRNRFDRAFFTHSPDQGTKDPRGIFQSF